MNSEVKKWQAGEGLGKIMAKRVNDALRELSSEARTHDKLSGIIGKTDGYDGEHRMTYIEIFGGAREEYAPILVGIGEKFAWTITAANYKDVIAAIEAGRVELRKSRPCHDERRTQEADAEQKAEYARMEAERNAEATAKAAKHTEMVAKLRADKPYLVTTDQSKLSRQALGAANIREELRRAFPGIVFRVTSESFAGGCSIDIGWMNGPTSRAVNAIVKRYEYGTFDSMTDCSGTDHDAYAFSEVFGGAKFVQCQNSIDPMTRAKATEMMQARFSADPASIERETNCLLANTGFLPGQTIVDVALWEDGEDRGDSPSPWKAILSEPKAPAAIPEASSEPVTGAGGVTVRQNEEKDGVEIHFPGKPAAEVLSGLKARGWRWSRFSKCWYHRRNPEALDYAAQLSGGALPASAPKEDTGMAAMTDVDSQYDDRCAEVCGQ